MTTEEMPISAEEPKKLENIENSERGFEFGSATEAHPEHPETNEDQFLEEADKRKKELQAKKSLLIKRQNQNTDGLQTDRSP